MTPTITPSKSRSAATADLPVYQSINGDLRDQLFKFKEATGDTNSGVGRKLGYPDGTAVSKYLNDKFDRDPQEFESRLLDLLKTESRRRAHVGEIYGSSVINQAAAFFDTVRHTNTVGVFHSPAGLGKSTAILAYLEANPTAVLLTANASQNDATGIRQLFWAAVDHRGHSPSQPRWDFLIQKFTGSGRLIIVDNAQRIASTGRDFLFDFRDATGCPIVMVGNPAILNRVAGNDQQFSRTLMEHEATLKDPNGVAKKIIDAHTDDGETIYDLALPIVRRPGGGHLRSLIMTLTAMREFLDLPAVAGDTRKAFSFALAKSIHHRA